MATKREEKVIIQLIKLHLQGKIDCLGREVLLKGKAQYCWPPCTNLFRSAPFYIENDICVFNKTGYLNEEVSGIEPFLSDSIPWCGIRIFGI
jgi:hypothetical protein